MRPKEYRTRLAARERAVLDIPSYRRAAVLVPLTLEPEPRLLLTVRTLDLRSHAGQIAFPGGTVEPGETPARAALREAQEEVGLEPAAVQVLGLMDDVWTPQGFQVTPVLGAFTVESVLAPNACEVAEILLAPVHELASVEPRRERRPLPAGAILPGGLIRGEVLHLDWRGHDIWGMTGAIVQSLLDLLR